ncbi:microtubule-associated protein futsch-like [Littorina saxatilis]|uniref:microtubule-associated protein futsch-like n=1 Tax=Littorina saxatilis TaxID=31220 RepID=UPI0038B42413
MSSIASPKKIVSGDSSILAASSNVSANKEQSWYQKLVQSAGQHQPPMEELLQQSQVPFLSPQRIQLQMHMQREYQQRQELQKNCRQDWWQRKSGPSPASGLPPVPGYTTPSSAQTLYAGTPHLQQQETPYFHGTPHPAMQQRMAMSPQSPMSAYLSQPAGADKLRAGVDNNPPGVERDWLEQEKILERDRMIKAAHIIKFDAEKRMREAQASTIKEQETVQMKILQLLKEHELAEQYSAASAMTQTRTPVRPNYPQSSNGDLQQKIARLLEAYRQLPKQLLVAAHQKNWQDQVSTYNNMLQAYGQGNLNQSYQQAKVLLQQLMQKEASTPRYSYAPGFSPHIPQCYYAKQQQQQQQVYPGTPGTQQVFRTPYPQRRQPVRPRRDPRLNQSSNSFQSQDLNVTPRLNQSYQYSEHDITQEVLYQGDKIAAKSGNSKLTNSTPQRKTASEKSSEDENGNILSKKGDKQEAEKTKRSKSPKRSTPKSDTKKPKEKQGKESGEAGHKVTFSVTPTKQANENQQDTMGRSAPKGFVHEWKQLEQRSKHHRKRRSHGHEQGIEESTGQHKKQDDKPAKGEPSLSSTKTCPVVSDATLDDKTKDKKILQRTHNSSVEEQEEKPPASTQKGHGGQKGLQQTTIPATTVVEKKDQREETSADAQAKNAPSTTLASTSSASKMQEGNKDATTGPAKEESLAIEVQDSKNNPVSMNDKEKKKQVEEIKNQKSEPESEKTQDAKPAQSAPSKFNSTETAESTAAQTAIASGVHDAGETRAKLKSKSTSFQDSKQGSPRYQQSKPTKEQASKESHRGTQQKSKDQQHTRSIRSPHQPPESKQPRPALRREFGGGSKSPRSNVPPKPNEPKSPAGALSKPSERSSPKGPSVSKSPGAASASPKQSVAPSQNHEKARLPGFSSLHPKKASVSPSGSDYSSKTEISPPENRRRRRRNGRRFTGQRDEPYDREDQGQAKSMSLSHKRGSLEHNHSHHQDRTWTRASPRNGQERDFYDDGGPMSRRRSWQWDESRPTPAKKMKDVGQRDGSFVSPKAESHKGQQPEQSADQQRKAQEPAKAASTAGQNSAGKVEQPKPAKDKKTGDATPKDTSSGPAENLGASGLAVSETNEIEQSCSSDFKPAEDATSQKNAQITSENEESGVIKQKGGEIKKDSESIKEKTEKNSAEKLEHLFQEKAEQPLDEKLETSFEEKPKQPSEENPEQPLDEKPKEPLEEKLSKENPKQPLEEKPEQPLEEKLEQHFEEKPKQPLEEKPETNLKHVLEVLAGMKARGLPDEGEDTGEPSDGQSVSPGENGELTSLDVTVPMQKEKEPPAEGSGADTSSVEQQTELKVTEPHEVNTDSSASESPAIAVSKEGTQNGQCETNTQVCPAPSDAEDGVLEQSPEFQCIIEEVSSTPLQVVLKLEMSDHTYLSTPLLDKREKSTENMDKQETIDDGPKQFEPAANQEMQRLHSEKPGTFYTTKPYESEASQVHASEEPDPEELAPADGKDEEIIICGEITGIIGPEPEVAITKVMFSLGDDDEESEDNEERGDEGFAEVGEICERACCMPRRKCQDPTLTNNKATSGAVLIDRLTASGII